MNATSPAVQWRRVLDIETGSYPNVRRTFVPVGCQHCDDPPCMHVCPTTATRKRPDGIVAIDYDLCIGCAYCDVACPYQARFKIDRIDFAYGTAMDHEQARRDERRVGVSQKCTFCSDRIDFGKANDLVPGVDAQATPACVNSCIADALHFGDVDDPDSNVSRLLRENGSFRMHAELGTDPNFHYLFDHRHGSSPDAGMVPVRGEAIDPPHQKHWDWKASLNFILGGSGASLLVFSLYDSISAAAWLALGMMALGLGILLLKIGRPLRFIYVLRQPWRSWMSREAWIAMVLFPCAILALTTGAAFLSIVAAVSAGAFLLAQAMILKESKGVPVWRTPHVIHLVILAGVSEGVAILSLFHPMTSFLSALVLMRAASWFVYLRAVRKSGAPARSLEVLRRFNPWMIGGGILAPLALIAASLPEAAAIAVVASGYALKFVLVTRAAYQQGFALGQALNIVRPGWNPVTKKAA
ncbi:MAG: 4Fe-4S dicluster domain-containing protein [Pseudorhodoplanes sp.]